METTGRRKNRRDRKTVANQYVSANVAPQSPTAREGTGKESQ